MAMQPENEPIFFVDAMLGNIAKKLRLMGYDTKYFSDVEDESLIQTAKKDNRIVISRDEDLVRISTKNDVNGIFIHSDKEVEQFYEILDYLNLETVEISGEKARCPNCNSTTESIDKKNIYQKIPQKVLDYNEKFWICKNCDQIFWEGTHIQNLQRLVRVLNERRK